MFSRSEFGVAAAALQAEVIHGPACGLFSVTDRVIPASVELIHRHNPHNLNSTDAAVLMLLLEHARAPAAPPCLLIASDQRLLRAAVAERLAALDPQQVSAAAVPGMLARL